MGFRGNVHIRMQAIVDASNRKVYHSLLCKTGSMRPIMIIFKFIPLRNISIFYITKQYSVRCVMWHSECGGICCMGFRGNLHIRM